ncbi:MAG: hypothetical protein AB7K09_04915 [Planctomycetota bacterium]
MFRRPAILLALACAICLPLWLAASALGGGPMLVCVSIGDWSVAFLPAQRGASPTPGQHGEPGPDAGMPVCPHGCHHSHSGCNEPLPPQPHPDEHDGHTHITFDSDGTLMPIATPARVAAPAPAGWLAVGDDASNTGGAGPRMSCAGARGRPPRDHQRPGALAAHAAILRL